MEISLHSINMNGIREALIRFDKKVKETKGMMMIVSPDGFDYYHRLNPGATICFVNGDDDVYIVWKLDK